MTYNDYGVEIEEHGPVEQRVLCPKCSHDRVHSNEKDLSVNTEKQAWFCHHCGWKGSIRGGEEAKPVWKVLTPRAKKATSPDSKLYKFFEARGISPAVVDRNEIGQSVEFVGETKQWCVAYPMKIGDLCYNEKFRSEQKGFAHQPGGTQIFYKLNDVALEDTCIICEGFEDALCFEEAGYRNAISVPSGALNPGVDTEKAKLAYLDNSFSYIRHCKKYILALDNDGPGITLRDELARRLGKRKCYVLEYPSNCKDANDVLLKYGADILAQCVKDASIYPASGTYTVSAVYDELDGIYENGYPKGLSLHMGEGVDKIYKVHPGVFTVLTGIPNAGKSPFIDWVSMRLAMEYGQKTAIFSPEHGFITNHATRLMRQYAGCQMAPHYNGRMTVPEYNLAKDFVNEHFYFVYPDDETFSLDKILDGYMYFVGKYGVKFIVLDPWNSIEHHVAQGENETIYTTKVLNKLRLFARDTNVHFALVAHPRKMKKKENSPHYEVPTPYDISGSQAFFSIPDICMTLYRQYGSGNRVTEYTRLYVQKMKWEYMGQIGTADFDFDVASQRFNVKVKEENTRFAQVVLNT